MAGGRYVAGLGVGALGGPSLGVVLGGQPWTSPLEPVGREAGASETGPGASTSSRARSPPFWRPPQTRSTSPPNGFRESRASPFTAKRSRMCMWATFGRATSDASSSLEGVGERDCREELMMCPRTAREARSPGTRRRNYGAVCPLQSAGYRAGGAPPPTDPSAFWARSGGPARWGPGGHRCGTYSALWCERSSSLIPHA